MRLLLSALLLFSCLSPAHAADPGLIVPATPGSVGQRALDDLTASYAAQYHTPPDIYPALKQLADESPLKRAAAAQYITAVLKQAVADENRIYPRQDDLKNVKDNPARDVHTDVAGAIEKATNAPELLEAQLYLIHNDPLIELAPRGARALVKNPSQAARDAYAAILSPAHASTTVMVTIINDVAARRLKIYTPQITALCNDPRAKVRQAARLAAAVMGIDPIPDFNPATSLSAPYIAQLKTFSSLVYHRIPKTASFKRFSFKRAPYQTNPPTPPVQYDFPAWLVSQDKTYYHVVTIDGDVDTIPIADATVTDTTLAHEARLILQQNEEARQKYPDSGPYIRPAEALLAAWAFDQNDPATAASLLAQLLDRRDDTRLVTDAVAWFISPQYHNVMVTAFISRDYPTALRVATHLSAAPFKDSDSYAQARDLVTQLPARTEDFKSFTLPTPDEWSALQQKLDRPAQIKYLTDHIRIMRAHQNTVPGSINFRYPQKPGPPNTSSEPFRFEAPPVVINPIVALRSLHLKAADILYLLPAIDDQNYLHACWANHGDPDAYGTLCKVSYPVAELINEIAATRLINLYEYEIAGPEKQKEIKDRILQWIAANKQNPRTLPPVKESWF